MMNIFSSENVFQRPPSFRLPFEIAEALKTVTRRDMRETGEELEERWIGTKEPLGACPELVKLLAAYAYRVARNGDEKKAEELGTLAARYCDDLYGIRLWHLGQRGLNAYKLLRSRGSWLLYYVYRPPNKE